jgi:hypothetical protein
LAIARQTTKSEWLSLSSSGWYQISTIFEGRKGIVDQNSHVGHLGKAGKVTAASAVPDDANAAVGELPASQP